MRLVQVDIRSVEYSSYGAQGLESREGLGFGMYYQELDLWVVQ